MFLPHSCLTNLLYKIRCYFQCFEFVKFDVIPDNLPNIRDELDQIFLVLAVVSNVRYLVTGDKDILDIQSTFHSPPILTLSQLKDSIMSIIRT